MAIKLRIKELRKKKNKGVDELAAYLDVSTTQIYNYENGSNSPPLDKLEKIAEFLEVKLGELLGLEGGIPPDIEKLIQERDALKKEYVELLKKYTQLIEGK